MAVLRIWQARYIRYYYDC